MPDYMETPTYTITLTEAERTAMAKVLGAFVTKLINAPVFVESASGGTSAARAVLAPPPTPAAAAPTPPPVTEPRDRWARDKKGNELAYPEDCVMHEILIWKAELKKPYNKPDGKQFLKVTWQSQESGYVDARCFDTQLFPWIIGQIGKKMTLYFVKSGEYLNIVGVRA
ncbi:MAG TPA: hypothetical protein VKF79_03390 [Candidatus Acidoferrum sp.]|nr:hypothetical protein [Candidatus Acidoferrum sp.]